MKKIYHLLFLFLGLAAFTACSPEQEDIFPNSATERSSMEINRIKQLLTNSENGWHMDYYGDLSYGGYNVLLQFKGDSVTIASEKAGTNHAAGLDSNGKCITSRSHFKLEQSMGVVLSVDEYNDVFHYFSMPNNPDYGTKDVGFEGDFEFRIIKATEDSIIMQGKKHEHRIVMTPIPSDVTWESLIQDAADTQAFIDSRNYTLEGEGFTDHVVGVKSYHTLTFQWLDSISQLQTVVVPFISKKDGYHFYRTYDVDGIKMDGLLKGDDRSKFYLSNNKQMWLYPYLPTLVEHLTENQWYIAYSNLGSYAQSSWDTFKTTFKERDDQMELYWAYIGTDYTRFGLHMALGNNTIYEKFNFTSNEDATEITMTWSTDESSAAKKNHKRWGLDDALKPFTGGRGHTFTIETDNQRDPSYLRLIDKNEPTNVITLMATGINYPFNR